ncbi:MAG: carboxypeptidase-like regulatory domain-containing protein [Paludibacteraceae bacterium]|nr:carboxypeptidase-like regulatory domain-containing protein [Paludibacteraceae bacterium]
MSPRKLIIGFWLLAIGYWPLYAVETILVGEVVNETTGEAIPNVNIHFRGTKIGTSSDENGNYALRVDMEAKCQLVFSAVGYFTQRFEIEPGTKAGLQVAMREKTATLTEIVVAPNENPALELLRQVRAHREANDRTMHKNRVFTTQKEQTLFVSHIGKRQLRRALWRSLQAGMIAQEDSTYILPLYRETQSFRFSGPEMIPANDQRTQALILSETDYSTLLGNEGNLNFYANSVSLMGHAFLSPLAAGGNLYYRYYILKEDDPTTNEALTGLTTNLVRISFRTRNPFYATFNGEMVIDTTNYALRSIQAYVPAEVAVNYVNTLHVNQTLAEDGTIADESISVLLDFTIKSEKAGTVFPTLLLTTSLRNKAADLRDLEVSTSRHLEPTTAAADTAFAALDSLPLMRTAKWFATIAMTGYIPTGTPVDIGHVEEILQVNQHEGVHIGLPFRTNERFSKVVSLEASVGYGFKDRSPKGMGRISVNLPTPRKNTLQLEYNDRYVWSEVDDFDRLLRENSMGWRNFDFTAYAFEALKRDSLCVNTALRQRQLQLHWFADWTDKVETSAYVRAGWMPASVSDPSSVISYQSLSLIARLSWGERKYDGYFMRRYAYSSKYPVLAIGAEFGHWANSQQSIANSQLYAHLRVLLTQHAQLGMGGTLSYALQAGALFGRVPQTLLWQADANQGYAYDPYRFTFLHGGELMADKYVTLQTEWNGQGILFNLIPGIRWLHLRELVEAKIAYGYLSNSVSGLTGEAGLTSISPKGGLYAELGIGLGNILRVCDLYSVWSLSPHIQWGMRFRIHLGL